MKATPTKTGAYVLGSEMGGAWKCRMHALVVQGCLLWHMLRGMPVLGRKARGA